MPKLPPEMLAEIAGQPKEWAQIVENPRFFQKPDSLATPDDAFTLLGHILWRWKAPLRYRQGGESFGERPQEALPTIDALDRALAAFVRAHPGALEALLAEPKNLKLLAFAQQGHDAKARREEKLFGGLPRTLLSVFTDQARAQEAELLWRTVRALDALSLWKIVLTAQKRYRPLLKTDGLGLAHRLLGSVLKHSGPDSIPELAMALRGILPPQLADVLPVLALPDGDFDFRFPRILPEDEVLCQMTPREITEALAHYRGMEAEELDAFLIRRRFLAASESVGAVIQRDTQTLRTCGISRDKLAEALRIALSHGNKPKQSPLYVEVTSYRGHHPDPFHDDDTYYLSREVGGSADCQVTNRETKEAIAFGSMLPYLIRRACFFEGSVPYRLDPAKACRVLAPLLK